jgi:hypothetical protein
VPVINNHNYSVWSIPKKLKTYFFGPCVIKENMKVMFVIFVNLEAQLFYFLLFFKNMFGLFFRI